MSLTLSNRRSETSPGLFSLATLVFQIRKRLFLTLGLQKDLFQLFREFNGSCNLDLSADNASRTLLFN